jgi:hypothetical protein
VPALPPVPAPPLELSPHPIAATAANKTVISIFLMSYSQFVSASERSDGSELPKQLIVAALVLSHPMQIQSFVKYRLSINSTSPGSPPAAEKMKGDRVVLGSQPRSMAS